MKSALILLTALLGSKVSEGSCGGIRALQDVPVEETSPSPLEEIVMADGAVVQIYEAPLGSGMMTVVSTVPQGAENPIKSYIEKASYEGTKKSVADFYVQISGKEPSGPLLDALTQQKANEDSESERKGWVVEDSEVPTEPDPTATDSGVDPTQRHLYAAEWGSLQWWLDTECRAMRPYDWCKCLTYRTGSGYIVKTSDDYIQSAYVYNGEIRSKLEYRTCSGGSCYWKYGIERVVEKGWLITIWAQGGGGSWTYKGSTSDVDGDGFHISRYDTDDYCAPYYCVEHGLPCFECPNINN